MTPACRGAESSSGSNSSIPAAAAARTWSSGTAGTAPAPAGRYEWRRLSGHGRRRHGLPAAARRPCPPSRLDPAPGKPLCSTRTFPRADAPRRSSASGGLNGCRGRAHRASESIPTNAAGVGSRSAREGLPSYAPAAACSPSGRTRGGPRGDGQRPDRPAHGRRAHVRGWRGQRHRRAVVHVREPGRKGDLRRAPLVPRYLVDRRRLVHLRPELAIHRYLDP